MKIFSCTNRHKVIFLFRFNTESIALHLLDFINEFIEAKGESVDPELPDKTFSEYFDNYLKYVKEIEDTDEIVTRINPEIMVKHAIDLFRFIAKKISTKN